MLVRCLSYLCYAEDKHPLHGQTVMNVVAYLFPEAALLLPQAW